MDFKKNTKCQFALGIAICFAVAAASVVLEKIIPAMGHEPTFVKIETPDA